MACGRLIIFLITAVLHGLVKAGNVELIQKLWKELNTEEFFLLVACLLFLVKVNRKSRTSS